MTRLVLNLHTAYSDVGGTIVNLGTKKESRLEIWEFSIFESNFTLKVLKQKYWFSHFQEISCINHKIFQNCKEIDI